MRTGRTDTKFRRLKRTCDLYMSQMVGKYLIQHGVAHVFCCWCWWLRSTFATNAASYDRWWLLLLHETNCILCNLRDPFMCYESYFCFFKWRYTTGWKPFDCRITIMALKLVWTSPLCKLRGVRLISTFLRGVYFLRWIRFKFLCHFGWCWRFVACNSYGAFSLIFSGILSWKRKKSGKQSLVEQVKKKNVINKCDWRLEFPRFSLSGHNFRQKFKIGRKNRDLIKKKMIR